MKTGLNLLTDGRTPEEVQRKTKQEELTALRQTKIRKEEQEGSTNGSFKN